MQEDRSSIIAAVCQKNWTNAGPERVCIPYDLFFFAVALIYRTRMEPAGAVETTKGWYAICLVLLSCSELKSVSLKHCNSLFRPRSS